MMKKLIALLLVSVLCVGLLPFSALAEDDEFKLVALGDSTANGYYLDDFGEYSGVHGLYPAWDEYGWWTGLLGFGSERSYPALLRDYLQSEMPDKTVTLTNLAASGMRSDEMRLYLDPDYEIDRFGAQYVRRFSNTLRYCFGEDPFELYPREVADADIITLDCCMNNFIDYFFYRCSAVLSGDKDEIEFYNDSIELTVPGSDKLVADLAALLTGFLPEGDIKGICDAFAYCYCDFCTNFSAIISLIRELNKDARIIVFGPFNPFVGITAELGGVELDVGGLYTILMSLLDTYLTVLCESRDDYSYVNLSAGLETLCETFAEAEDASSLSPVMLERFVYSFYDTSSYLYLKSELTELMKQIGYENGVRMLTTLDRGSVMRAYADVSERGDDASLLNRLIVELHNELIGLILKGAAESKVYVDPVLEVFDGSLECFGQELLRMHGTDYDELTDGQRSILKIIAMATVVDGCGIHPSENGCRQKFELARKAYADNKPASSSAGQVGRSVGFGAAESLLVLIRAPLLDTVEKLLSSFDLVDFFANIAQQIQSFFLKLLPC